MKKLAMVLALFMISGLCLSGSNIGAATDQAAVKESAIPVKQLMKKEMKKATAEEIKEMEKKTDEKMEELKKKAAKKAAEKPLAQPAK